MKWPAPLFFLSRATYNMSDICLSTVMDPEREVESRNDAIRISRLQMELLLRGQDGMGLTKSIEAQLGFYYHKMVDITRYELESILTDQGGKLFSDAQWSQLMSVYPLEHEEVVVTPPQRSLLTEELGDSSNEAFVVNVMAESLFEFLKLYESGARAPHLFLVGNSEV